MLSALGDEGRDSASSHKFWQTAHIDSAQGIANQQPKRL